MGFLGLGADKVQTTTEKFSQNVDPVSQAYVQQQRNYAQQAAMGAQTYQTQGSNIQQQQAMQALQANLGLGGMGAYTPQQVQAGQVQAAQTGAPQQVGVMGGYEQVSGPNLGGIPQVGGVTGAGSMPQAGRVGPVGDVRARGGYQGYDPQAYQGFMDPYTNEVVDSMRPEFDRQRQQAMTTGSQQATMAGALGNNRGELLQASMLRDVNQNEAQMMAQLRSQGFGQAQAAAMGEHELGQNLGLQYAGQNLQGQMSNQQARLQAGMANAQLGTQAALAGGQLGAQYAGLNMQGQAANQGAYMQGLGLQQQAGMANQGAGLQYQGLGLQGQMANQGAGLQTDQANAGRQQQAGMANQQAGLQAGMANQQAGLQGAQMDRSYNLGMGGLQMQQAGALYGMGEQERQIAQAQNLDPYTRNAMGAGVMNQNLGPYGTSGTNTTEQRQKGNLFGDIMNFGSMLSGFVPFAGGGGGTNYNASMPAPPQTAYSSAPMQSAVNAYAPANLGLANYGFMQGGY